MNQASGSDTLSVLLIDSDQKIRRLVMSALEPFQARIVQSASVREAELELAVSEPELIVLDCVQSDADAVEWLQIKRSAGLSSRVIFLCSGSHSTEGFCRLLKDPRVIAVVHKPVTASIISRILEKNLCADASGSASASTTPTVSEADLDEIEKEIRALSLEYIRELPARLSFLKRQVLDIKSGKTEASTAKNEAHKIKGTASSYGVHSVGEQAVIIDDCLKLITKGDTGPEIWERLERSLDEACRQADLALKDCDSQSAAPVVYDAPTAMANLGLAGQGQRIVIIDDDEDFTRRLSMVLGYEDMLVYSFNDAKNLNEILTYLEPDLLILDLNMPGLDGFEVCKRVRIESRWRSLPIIFITAQTGWETRVAAFDAGGDDYIPKPVVNQELIARIRVRVEKSRLQKEVDSQSSVNRLLWQSLLTILVNEKLAALQD